jgi:Uma2 family endonuclease
MATASTKADVYYPESDGEPMGETIQHRDATIDLILALQDWFVDDPLAYVSGDEFLYYVEGQPRFVVSPDVWAVRGIDKTIPRPIYKTWLEGGKGPDVVIEVTSKSTRRVDQGKKFRIYQDDLKVREYFLFDPLAEYLKPPLQGHRLFGGEYRPIEPVAGRLPSEVLGLHLEAEGDRVRLFEPVMGRRLLNRLERLKALDEAVGAREEANRELIAQAMAREETIRELIAQAMAREETIRELTALVQVQLTMVQDQQVVVQEARKESEESRLAKQEAELAKLQAELAKLQAEKTLLLAQIEIERLRQELEALRPGLKPKPKPKRK